LLQIPYSTAASRSYESHGQLLFCSRWSHPTTTAKNTFEGCADDSSMRRRLGASRRCGAERGMGWNIP